MKQRHLRANSISGMHLSNELPTKKEESNMKMWNHSVSDTYSHTHLKRYVNSFNIIGNCAFSERIVAAFFLSGNAIGFQ